MDRRSARVWYNHRLIYSLDFLTALFSAHNIIFYMRSLVMCKATLCIIFSRCSGDIYCRIFLRRTIWMKPNIVLTFMLLSRYILPYMRSLSTIGNHCKIIPLLITDTSTGCCLMISFLFTNTISLCSYFLRVMSYVCSYVPWIVWYGWGRINISSVQVSVSSLEWYT